MEHYSSLQDLIEALEAGNRYHISVMFPGKCISRALTLTTGHTIHATPFCDAVKQRPRGLERCMRCKALAVEKCFRTRRAFSGLCINGVYEYCHPVVLGDGVFCVVFVGNILRDRTAFCEKNALLPEDSLPDTMEPDMPEARCARIAGILDSYIRMLYRLAPESPRTESPNPTVLALQGYVDRYFSQDISLSQLAKGYHYNEKYLGRLFKQQLGVSFRDYLNEKRLEYGKDLLARSGDSVLDIAARAGFNNVTYFNRLFRRRYGMTPTEFRRKNQP